MLPFGKAVWWQGSISFETEAYGTNRQDTKSSIAEGVINSAATLEIVWQFLAMMQS